MFRPKHDSLGLQKTETANDSSEPATGGVL